MAFAVETSSSTSNTFVSSLTFSHTVTAANLLVLVAGAGDGTAGNRVLSSATYAAAAMSDIPGGTSFRDDSNFLRVSAKYKATPATGANNVVVTYAGSCACVAAGVTGFTDADGTTPFGTVVVASSTANANASVTVTIGTGEIGIAGVSSDANATITENRTLAWEQQAIGADCCFGGQTTTTTGSVAMSWTGSTPDNGWAAMGFAVKPTSGGGGTFGRLVGGTLCGGLLTGGLLSQ